MKITLSLLESMVDESTDQYNISQAIVTLVEDGLDVSQAVTRYLAEEGKESGLSEKDVAKALAEYPISNTAGAAMVSEKKFKIDAKYFNQIIREELEAIRAEIKEKD